MLEYPPEDTFMIVAGRCARRCRIDVARVGALVVEGGPTQLLIVSRFIFRGRHVADRFEQEEIPRQGRYVVHPARADENGLVWVPPDPLPRAIARGVAPLAAGLAVAMVARRFLGRREKS